MKKVLIANRGEIALRIIRACKEEGIKSVAVFSTADKDSMHVKLADEAVCIGESRSTESYLDIKRIISAAEISGSDAIHPGYGFLAENANFAEICKSCGIKFIGPAAESISSMGDKANAKKIMRNAGVPVVPGSEGTVSDIDDALEIAEQIGFPVIIKATAGGGGKGMRIATDKVSFINSFQMSQIEAQGAFGNDSVYIEKYIERPRHIEVQILADEHGNAVHLGERDCSIQRRHQKLVEEALSPSIDSKKRKELGDAAIKAVHGADYFSAGTVEFIFDSNDNFYFMEMNTRIQVEHPVTELVTGIDIVKEQLRIANGGKLSFKQKDIKFMGHAIECRINAEDPKNNFSPSPGRINKVHFPGGPGIRVDSHIYNGYFIPPYYDSMVAKLLAWGIDRKEAIQRMKRALNELVVDGVKTTADMHKIIMNNQDFDKGNIDTTFITKIEI